MLQSTIYNLDQSVNVDNSYFLMNAFIPIPILLQKGYTLRFFLFSETW